MESSLTKSATFSYSKASNSIGGMWDTSPTNGGQITGPISGHIGANEYVDNTMPVTSSCARLMTDNLTKRIEELENLNLKSEKKSISFDI